jgi:hypothetical protein
MTIVRFIASQSINLTAKQGIAKKILDSVKKEA